MKLDYHVHPNLYGKELLRRRLLAAIWKSFSKHELDAVICAEHSFKDAPDAYRSLIAARPKDARTQVFPGAELVASDGRGVDVIAFADHDWYDDHRELLRPYGMTLAEMLRYLRASELHYFIPHPLLMGQALGEIYDTEESMEAFLTSVPAFEAFNSSFLLLEHLFQYPFVRPLLRSIRNKMRRSAQVDLETYKKDHHRFLAIGSDAHHPWELGFCVEVPGERPATRSEIFRVLTSNTDIQTLHFPTFDRTIIRLIAMGWTTLNEAILRRISKRAAPAPVFLEDALTLHADLP